MPRDFQRIAIVNRGEPAMRLIHAVREFNREHDADLRTIALYTEPDRRALFVREADEAHSLGSVTFTDPRDGERKNRYLDYEALEQALKDTRAEAVWVGWGFVSEHAAFVDLCDRLGIVFIGPSGDTMRKLGDKVAAKLLAEAADVPVAPWSGGPVETLEEAREHAEKLGYPLMVKAAAGGGGRGIRVVRSLDDLADAFERSRAEALKAFGDATVFLEKRVTGAHHVEVQIIGDGERCWAVGVRDCTLQRRHQKVLEETPSPVLTEEQDREIRAAAARLGEEAGYSNAGTVEFLYDPDEKTFAFMEVNTRLQVEHPVTELVTGLDLVKLQLHVARGGKLEGDPPPAQGHAIEVRLTAEDPENSFAPAPGTVALFRLPTGPGLRIDTGVVEGDEIAPQFDSMIAKMMAYGRDRAEAMARLHRALAESVVVIRGGMSNKGFLLRLLTLDKVRAADYDIGWLDGLVATGEHVTTQHAEIALLAVAIEAYEDELAVERAQFYQSASRGRPEVGAGVGRTVELSYGGQGYELGVFRLGPDRYEIAVEGRRVEVRVEERGPAERRLTVAGTPHRVFSVSEGILHLVEVDGIPHRVGRDAGGAVRAPAPAVVVTVDVEEGDRVEVGDRLAVVEAMKMEMAILAEVAGTVREVHVRKNVQVGAGSALVTIEPDADGVATADVGRISFDALGPAAVPEDDHQQVCRRTLDEVESLVLGYDVDPAALRRLLARQGAFCVGLPPDDPVMRASEDRVLQRFADLAALFHRQRAEEDLGEEARRSVEDYLYTYLRDLDGKGEQLPPRFLEKLRLALEYYGIESLERTPELEEALFRIAKAHQRMDQQVTPVLSILQRRLDARDALAEKLDEHDRQLLSQVVLVTQGTYPSLNDLARQVRYRYFAQPLLESNRQEAYDEAEEHLAALEQDPDSLPRQVGAADRAERITALVENGQPLKSLLAGRFEAAEPALRRVLLEVITRRYYRIRDLRNVEGHERDGRTYVTAEYEFEGDTVHVVTTHAAADDFPAAADALCPVAESFPEGHYVVVDFYLWKDGPLGDPEETAEELLSTINASDCPRQLRRIVVALSGPESGRHIGGTQHFTFRPPDAEGASAEAAEGGYWEERFYGDVLYRGLHPMMAKRLHLYRLEHFDVERLPSAEDVYVLRAVAKENPKDERLFGVAEVRALTPVRDSLPRSGGESGRAIALPHLERMLMEVLAEIRHVQAGRPGRRRLHWNYVLLYVWPPLNVRPDELAAIARRVAPATEGLGIEAVVVHARVPDPKTGELHETVITAENVADTGLSIRYEKPRTDPIPPLSAYDQKVLRLKQRGLLYPYEIVRMLAPETDGEPTGIPRGSFQEYDLDEDNNLVPVDRPYGQNTSNIIVGLVTNVTPKYPEGMERVILLGDPSRGMGNIAEAECRRINAALELAAERQIPCEWFAHSAGAKIAMDSGTENMDWIALTLRRIIEFTQAGGELNIIIVGINVGAQPYWNAEATMLMHTRGILIMTADAAMVLTGKQALDYSGGVSAEDNLGIGGYERIMGPNGQAQYGARDVVEAAHLLLRYYDHTYVVPGERFPRRAATSDPADRDVRAYPHGRVAGVHFDTLGEVFSDEHNPGRKKPFDIRKVMRAVSDQDHQPMERWFAMENAETGVVWDAHIGGHPVCLLGLESRPVPRLGFVPADGPDTWTGGTLFPRSSKKVARAVNAASGNRPLVVLGNLSGFDGSPESMREWQLEFGAEIGRAVTNFRGPIVFVVVSRYHGGAFVVFSGALNEQMEIAALEGTYASVIGGAPAAAVVFARDVRTRAQKDERVKALEEQIQQAEGAEKVRLQARMTDLFAEVYSEKLGEVAVEYDGVHSVRRAQEVGSVHRIIAPERLRPYVIDAVERGMRKELERVGMAEPAEAPTNGQE